MTGAITYWLLNNSTVIATGVLPSFGDVSNWKVVGTPDLNRDGKADILLQSASAPPRAKNPFGFVGKAGYYSDEESGLQLLGHRYYLPKLGRFLTQDPTGHDAGLNLYEYVNNNPLIGIDPIGHQGVIATSKELLSFDTWREGFNTFMHAMGANLTFGLYDGGDYKNAPGFAGSRVLSGVGLGAGTLAGGAALAGALATPATGMNLALGLSTGGSASAGALGTWAENNGFFSFETEPLMFEAQSWQSITGWMWNSKEIAFRLNGMTFSGFWNNFVLNPGARAAESISTNKELWYIFSNPSLWSRTNFINPK